MHDLAEPGLSTRRASSGGEDHSAGIELLHVVHEVDADARGRAGVEHAEHAGLAGGRNDLDVRESGIARQLGHVLRPLREVAVFGGDGRQRDPVLQGLDCLVVHLGNLAEHGLHVGVVGGKQIDRQRRQDRACHGALNEVSACEFLAIFGGHF